MIRRLREPDHMILFLNLLLLMSIAVLPFATDLMAAYLRQSQRPAPRRRHLQRVVPGDGAVLRDAEPPPPAGQAAPAPRRRSRSAAPAQILARSVSGVIPYAIATALAIVSPYVTLAICAALARLLRVPDRAAAEPPPKPSLAAQSRHHAPSTRRQLSQAICRHLGARRTRHHRARRAASACPPRPRAAPGSWRRRNRIRARRAPRRSGPRRIARARRSARSACRGRRRNRPAGTAPRTRSRPGHPTRRSRRAANPIRFRDVGHSACTPECEATIGPTSIRATSQKPASFRWLTSIRIPSSAQRRTSARPASVSPGPVSGEDGEMNGTPWANAFERLHTGPIERSPAAVPQVERLEPGSIASAPSRWSTAAGGPSSSRNARSRSAPLRATAGAGALEREQPPGDRGRVRGRHRVLHRRRGLELDHPVVARDLHLPRARHPTREHREDRPRAPRRRASAGGRGGRRTGRRRAARDRPW